MTSPIIMHLKFEDQIGFSIPPDLATEENDTEDSIGLTSDYKYENKQE